MIEGQCRRSGPKEAADEEHCDQAPHRENFAMTTLNNKADLQFPCGAYSTREIAQAGRRQRRSGCQGGKPPLVAVHTGARTGAARCTSCSNALYSRGRSLPTHPSVNTPSSEQQPDEVPYES